MEPAYSTLIGGHEHISCISQRSSSSLLTALHVSRHIVHEVTSPQAFEGLTLAKRPVRRKDCTLVTVDHNIPTESRKDFKSASTFIKEADSRLQCVTLEENVKAFGLTYFGMTDKRQGIVHVSGKDRLFAHTASR